MSEWENAEIIAVVFKSNITQVYVVNPFDVITRAGTNTPSDEYDTYRDTGWRIRYVSRIHFFSEAKLGNG